MQDVPGAERVAQSTAAVLFDHLRRRASESLTNGDWPAAQAAIETVFGAESLVASFDRAIGVIEEARPLVTTSGDASARIVPQRR